MRITIFEIGKWYDIPRIIRVFSSIEKAMENVPSEFKKRESFPFYHYYEDEINERWLGIKEHEVED